jgi:hypothetical protein
MVKSLCVSAGLSVIQLRLLSTRGNTFYTIILFTAKSIQRPSLAKLVNSLKRQKQIDWAMKILMVVEPLMEFLAADEPTDTNINSEHSRLHLGQQIECEN